MHGSKNILKKLDFKSMDRKFNVPSLPPSFNGDVIYILPPALLSSVHKNAKSIEEMDKRYDGHLWTRTMTTNMSTTFGLTFRYSYSVGHLQCHNCAFLERSDRATKVNKMEFEGITKVLFVVGEVPLTTSTLVSKICKEPPLRVALCTAKIYYVFGEDNQERACVHVGTHEHPVKVGDYRCMQKKIDELIEQHVDRNPQTTVSKIVMETNKDLLGNYLLRNEADPKTTHLSLEQLEPVFEQCKELNTFALMHRVYTFKYLRKYGVLYGITKLRGYSNWAYVQCNISQAKKTTLIKASSSICPRSALAATLTSFAECNLKATCPTLG